MNNTRKLVYTALLAALTAAGAFMRIPMGYSSVTLQYLFTAMAGLLLGRKWGALSQFVYVFLGLVGLPIFTMGGGFGYVFQPTFGFLLGLIPAAWVVGAAAGDKVLFVPRGVECSPENAVKTQVLASSLRVAYAFSEAESDKAYDFCYVFDSAGVSEAPIKYDEYAFTVRQMPALTAENAGHSSNGAVVSVPKTFVVSTQMASVGDFVVLSAAADACATVSGISFGPWHIPDRNTPAVGLSTGRSFG